MDSYGFVSAAAVPIKSARASSVCARSSAFAGADIKNAYYPAAAWSVTKMLISQAEVLEVQKKWSDGVVKIGSLKDQKAELEAYTNQFLDERYAFNVGSGKVLFKPTKCADEQFRPTKPDALSYFIAGDAKKYSEDGGFAVTPWTAIRWENTGFVLEDNRAIVQGNYYFTDTSGGETKVEYTFGYTKVDGDLKIDLHHSSLPFPK